MIKKTIIFIFAIFLMTSSVYAEKLTVYKESGNVEEAVDRLMAGEDVPVMDLLKFPNSGSSTYSSRTYVSEKAYTQLDSVEKAIYDSVDEKYTSTMNGKFKISCEAEIPLSSGYDNTTTEGKNSIAAELNAYGDEKLGYNITRALYALCAYDKPQYFWIDISKISINMSASYSGYDSETGILKVTLNLTPYDGNSYYYGDYSSFSQVKAEYNALYERVDEITAALPSNASDFQKLLIINEWLLNHNTYNPDLSSGTESFYAYIAPSALLYGDGDDTADYPVCEGYAEAFKIICDKIGIDCVCGEAFGDTDGDGDIDSGHKWNLVNMDGEWYYYDGTWNDSGNSSYIYYRIGQFLIGRESMAAVDNLQTHKFYHDLDKAQLGFENPVPNDNDYITNRGLAGLTSLDFYKDNVIDCRDIAQSMKNLINDSLTVDINKDGSIDLIDSIDFMKLMYK